MPQNVFIFVYPGYATLDVSGPVMAFGNAFIKFPTDRYFKLHLVAKDKGPVTSSEGTKIEVDFSVDELLKFEGTKDVLLMPGAFMDPVKAVVADKEFIEKYTQLCKQFQVVTSVCTGAAILAQTGLLNGLTATTNKQAFNNVEKLVKETVPDSNICWIKKRWVSHLNDYNKGVVTSSGVSAGTDMALAVIASLHGENVANDVATLMEWNRISDPNNDL